MIKKTSLTRLTKKKISTDFTDALVQDMWRVSQSNDSPKKEKSKPPKELQPTVRMSLRDMNLEEDQSSDSDENPMKSPQ